MNRRPNRTVVEALMAADGSAVTYAEDELIENVDGIPLGVHSIREAVTLAVSLSLLGWTQAEYDNPEITE